MKDVQLDNITEEEAAEYLLNHRDKVLSDFATAYLAETGLKPSEIELIHEIKREDSKVTESYYFREKIDG